MSDRDDLANLPRVDREWNHRWRDDFTDEELAINRALEVIAKHAFEARDRRMCGRVLAAKALCSEAYWWLWEDCTNLIDESEILGLPIYDYDAPPNERSACSQRRGDMLRDHARQVFVSGVRRRPRALLRAEARGILFCLRWLYRAGLLERRALSDAELAPWRRKTGAPPEAHPHILGPLPPTGTSLN